MSVFLVLLAVFGVSVAIWYWRRHRGIPPGPHGLPFLGYAPFLTDLPAHKLTQLGEKYGGVYSMYLGTNLVIVLSSYEAIFEAFVKKGDLFLGRAGVFVLDYLSLAEDQTIHGLLQSDGFFWKTAKRFMLRTFRDLGVGKTGIQTQIVEEVKELCDQFAATKGQSFDFLKPLSLSISNIMCILCFGKRFGHSDAEHLTRVSKIAICASYIGQLSRMHLYPWTRFIPGPFHRHWQRFVEAWASGLEFMQQQIEEHREQRKGQPENDDYIFSFLEKAETVDQDEKTVFTDFDLACNVRVFFGAGTETTRASLQWAFLYVLWFPDIQKKVQAEIDANIPSDNFITTEDRVLLPYTEAVIREVQRLGNAVPFGVYRANFEETVLFGYRIPKRSFILPNFRAVNLDPKLWPEPKAFKPERFLDACNKLKEPSAFMPFSVGKRKCVGESLARMEIFLFFVNVLQRFDVISPEGQSLPPLDEYVTGISASPRPFNLRAIPRATQSELISAETVSQSARNFAESKFNFPEKNGWNNHPQ